MCIKIERGDCTDAADQAYEHSMQIDIDGAVPLQGCGDLAVY